MPLYRVMPYSDRLPVKTAVLEPPPPLIVSLPLPPVSVLSAALPVRVSFPMPPMAFSTVTL